MSPALAWSNLVAYSLQIGLLIGVAAAAPALLRLASPKAKLAYWYLLLAACLLLPLVRPWRPQAIAGNVTMTTTVIATSAPAAPARRTIAPVEIALAIVVFGTLCRLFWLGVGFYRLRRLRLASRPIAAPLPWPSAAELRIGDAVASPVTFGLRRPVILLPAQFPSLDWRAQQAILCHELLHVDRADWAFTIAEELVRAAFWFHPAIWWLLGEIQLAREQAVDRAVVELTQAKDEYVDALLAIAGARPQLDLAPAPLFLRKRHLKHRVVSILKEVRMSKTRLASTLAGSVCVLAAAAWFVTNTFPLAAAPQVVNDSAGVTVDAGGGTLLHRSPVVYPETLRNRGVAGTVVLELTFDASGNVADARAVSGPEELRKPALQSALQWHFAHEAAGNKRQVTISFVASAAPAIVRKESAAFYSNDAGKSPARVLKSINVIGLSDDAKQELLAKLPVHVGDTITPDMMPAISKAAMEFDEHLRVMGQSPRDPDFFLTILAPSASTPMPAVSVATTSEPRIEPPGTPNRIKVGGNVQSSKLVRQPRPIYPPEAKEARIQGVVKLGAVIGKDGTIQHLEVISGHPLLVPSALEAVKQWVYETTLLNGNPVEVQTQIDVNYTLSQ
jgi:TonB family protein